MTYRRVYGDVPLNDVSANIHMSGECLCGAYAHSGELEEIEEWYPAFVAYIRDLEHRVQEAGVGDEAHRTWGWDKNKPREHHKAAGLCGTCRSRSEAMTGVCDQ